MNAADQDTSRSEPKSKRNPIRALLARIDFLFIASVLAPTLLAAYYFSLIASDIYISESRFVVRTSQQAAPTGLVATLMQNTGFARSQDDTFAVHDFIKSRDALRELDRQMGLHKAFSDSTIDFLNRFAAIDRDDSFEALHKYYQRQRVSVETDPATSISVLRVSAFTAEYSVRINETLLALSERLVNQLSERARADLVRFATAEVAAAEKKAREASLALADFRSLNAVIDPERQTTLQYQQIAKLQDELVQTRAQLSQLRAFTPDNPQIPALVNRQESLQKASDAEMARVAGKGASLSNKASGYERVAFDRAFADRQLATAMASLEAARNEAARKQLYLERIVQPNKPDVAMEPRRIRSVIVVFLLGLVSWGILALLVNSIREHRQ